MLIQGVSRQLFTVGTAPPLGTQGTNYQAQRSNGTDLQTANGI
jgi:hypothetical protein